MTLVLRAMLIVVSVTTFFTVTKKIRNSKMRIEDSVFWVLLCVMFVVFAVCPPVADALAHLIGIYSTANFLFLFIIFLLLMKVFSLSTEISELEQKLKEIAQKYALSEDED